MIFCAVCRLTFCWRWCIMKIRPAACASGPSKRALCILTKKEGRCPSQLQHISKNSNRFSSLSGNITECPPSSVKCSASIFHPMRLITAIAAALLSAFRNSNHTVFVIVSPFYLSAQSRAERIARRFLIKSFSSNAIPFHSLRFFSSSSKRMAFACVAQVLFGVPYFTMWTSSKVTLGM